MISNTLVIRVPGKVILSGEHSVVYGFEAVVAAVNRFITLSISWDGQTDQQFFQQLLANFSTLNVIEVINAIDAHAVTHSVLKLESEIPLGCGMGSSAALASALSLLCLIFAQQPHDLETINRYSFLLEKQAHENPSGIDNTIVTRGGIIKYQRKPEGTAVYSSLNRADFLDNLYLVNTGKPAETTAELVQKVRKAMSTDPKKIGHAMSTIAEATQVIIRCLMSKPDDRQLRDAFNKNEDGLEQIGVVSDSCIEFIKNIRSLGGVAKVSGAGGYKTHSGVVLVYPGNEKRIYEFLKSSGFDFSPLQIDGGITHQITHT